MHKYTYVVNVAGLDGLHNDLQLVLRINYSRLQHLQSLADQLELINYLFECDLDFRSQLSVCHIVDDHASRAQLTLLS